MSSDTEFPEGLWHWYKDQGKLETVGGCCAQASVQHRELEGLLVEGGGDSESPLSRVPLGMS